MSGGLIHLWSTVYLMPPIVVVLWILTLIWNRANRRPLIELCGLERRSPSQIIVWAHFIVLNRQIYPMFHKWDKIKMLIIISWSLSSILWVFQESYRSDWEQWFINSWWRICVSEVLSLSAYNYILQFLIFVFFLPLESCVVA